MRFLRKHPFAVEAFFKSSTVLTFAVPKDELAGLIPSCVSLDTFEDKWAFIAIAMVDTKDLRPKGFPKFMGNDFFLSGYRIFVRYRSKDGRNLRGLYIIKSETNKRKMQFFGNIFTQYQYTTTDIHREEKKNRLTLSSKKSQFSFCVEEGSTAMQLPAHSPFNEWKEARRFAGPLPYTFTYDKAENTVLVIKGVRQNWSPIPLHVHHYKFEFLDDLKLNNIVLANAFQVKNVPYHWEKGRKEFLE